MIDNFSRLIKKQRSLNLYQRTFSQFTLVLPFMILAEGVQSGELEVGRATQAAGAFTAVLRHHTHVLHLTGEGAWELHEASGFQFDAPGPALKMATAA